MFYNLDESKDENLQQRKTHDEKVVGEIINKLLDGVPAEFKIEKLVRVGKGGSASNPKPLKVTVNSVMIKGQILRAPRAKLESDVKYKNVRIGPDRTPTQRQNYGKLRKEMETRVKGGEECLMIKYGKIVSRGAQGVSKEKNKEQHKAVEKSHPESQDKVPTDDDIGATLHALDKDSEEEKGSDEEKQETEGDKVEEKEKPESATADNPRKNSSFRS